MIEIEATCTRCRGDPHPKPLQSITSRKCQVERKPIMSTTETETVFSLESARTEARLAGQREQLRRTPGDRVLALDIAAGDERVRQLRRDHAVHVRVEQERAQADRQRDQDARAELEARLIADYRQASLGTTAAEAKAALPDLLHRHRLGEQDRMDAALVEQRRRLGAF